MDPTSSGYLCCIEVSQSDKYMPGAVYEVYAHAERPVGLPESAVTSGKFQMVSKWHW